MSDVTPAPEKKPAEVVAAGKNSEWWVGEVSRSFKGWRDYRDKAKKVLARYRDERKDSDSERKRFNILYSNTETMGPVVYSQAPVPDIRRRFQDKDDVARLTATILQRATQYSCEAYDFDGVLDRCKKDYLLPGFAVARVVYRPYFKQPPQKAQPDPESPAEDASEGQEELPELIYQEVGSEYIPWDRFAMSRTRIYERVWWAAVADDLTKDEIRAQFGDIADELNYSGQLDDKETEEKDREATCRIWEVWCKRGRVRFFVAEGYPGWVKAPEADPLRLENFYPWPKPIWAIETNDSLTPIPEYCEYQDQAIEMDDLTERIDVLTSALRRRGVYDATNKDVLADLANGADNTFRPIENWAALMEKGGLANIWHELPIDGLAKIILQLEERREVVKQTIYEVTGLSDIIRGATKANETATAQNIKGQWAGLRVSTRQKRFADFARDLIRLKAEVIAERFDPQTLQLMSGVQLPQAQDKQRFQQQQALAQQQMQQYQQIAQRAQQAGQQPPPQPQIPPPTKEQTDFYAQPSWDDVMQVLRNDKLRGFKIDIETDSTVAPDAQAEQQGRTQLLQAIGTFSQNVAPAIQEGLMPPELAAALIKFAVRAYKVGSEVEQVLEELGQNAVSPQNQQAQKQIQEQQQALQKQQAQVQQDTHASELKKKDSDMAAEQARHAKEVFDLVTRHHASLADQQAQHEQQLHQFAGHAEQAVRDAINPTPQQ